MRRKTKRSSKNIRYNIRSRKSINKPVKVKIKFAKSMEFSLQKQQNGRENVEMSVRSTPAGNHFDNHLRCTPTLVRKVSKRRQVHEQRTVVLELFKDLIAKVNEEFTKIHATSNSKSNRIPKISRLKSKQKAKELCHREPKQQKINSEHFDQILLLDEKKKQIWANYSVIMGYQIMEEQSAVGELAEGE